MPSKETEVLKEKGRRYRAAVKADPVRWKRHQELQKIARDKRKELPVKKYKVDSETGAAYQKRFHERHPEKRAEYRQKRKARINELNRRPQSKLHRSISVGMCRSLKKRDGCKAGRKWNSLVGYTLQELMVHLEALFTPGMSWTNYGQWEVDHVQPQASFSFSCPMDPGFQECWALSNLQPLWERDNLLKGDSVPEA